MENRLKINHEIVDLIIKLCLNINQLKNLHQNNNKSTIHLFNTYKDIKNKMDEVLGALSTRSMSRKIQETSLFVNNISAIYKLYTTDFENRTLIITTFNKISKELLKLELKVSDIYNTSLEK